MYADPVSETHAAVDEPILKAIIEAQARHELFPADHAEETVAVIAVSGGADSVCLLHALAQLAPTWHLRLIVAHMDHALRPDSARDAALVKSIAGQLGLICHSTRLAPNALQDNPRGLEAAARAARYAFLCRVADDVTPQGQTPLVAVAHHGDDQAETVVMHLVRGSGLRGLSGMRWVSERRTSGVARPVRIVRPLLAVTRREIRQYVAAHKLNWREDPSNADMSLLRNRLRHAIMPELLALNPNLVQTLGRTAQILADEAARVESLDRRAFAALTGLDLADDEPWGTEQAPERVVVPVERLLSLDSATQRGVLRLALRWLGVDLRQAGVDRIEELLAQLARRRGASGPHPLTQGIAWTLAPTCTDGPLHLSLHPADSLPLDQSYPRLEPGWRAAIPLGGILAAGDDWQLVSQLLTVEQLPPDWQERPWSAFFDVERLADPILTTPKPGLRFAPLGMRGHHKLLGDFFTDRKVPVAERAGWPVVVDGQTGEVIWVCGHAVGHGPRIASETHRILALAWVPTVDGSRGPEEGRPEMAAGPQQGQAR